MKGCTFGEGQVKELLKGTNVPLGNSESQYEIENTSTWSLGGQRIFLRKTSYLSSTLMISMKFCENKKENENTPNQKTVVNCSSKYSKKSQINTNNVV